MSAVWKGAGRRISICGVGLRDGVLMYDRERVVARLTPPTGPISVTQLLADRDGNVWAGTSAASSSLASTSEFSADV